MKATMQREERYTITLGVHTFPNLRAESQWEGLTKLSNSEGFLIVTGISDRKPVASGFTTAFGDIFGDIFGLNSIRVDADQKSEVHLLFASQKWAELLKAGKEDA